MEFKPTSQYIVKFNGQSSKPYVQEPPRRSNSNPHFTYLELAGPSKFSDNIVDYTVTHNGTEVKLIDVNDNVLTIETPNA